MVRTGQMTIEMNTEESSSDELEESSSDELEEGEIPLKKWFKNIDEFVKVLLAEPNDANNYMQSFCSKYNTKRI